MWFKRKPKNRRFEREHVLDVKLRTSESRAAQLRMLSIALAVSFSTIVILFFLWRGGEWVLNQLIFENEAFAVRKVEVQTDGVIALDQLRQWAKVREGDNLLALDLGRVKRDLELVPWIASVAVERILPNTLRLTVVEREPVAQVQTIQPSPTGAGLVPVTYFLDPTGYVMLPLARGQRAAGAPPMPDYLPSVSGVLPAEMRPGRAVDSPQVRAALRLVQEFEQSPMVGLVDLARVEVASPGILQVVTGQGSEVNMAITNLATQLRRWREVHEFGMRAGRVIATLDLSIPNNIPARWVEAAAAPAPNAKPVKPNRSKKKHV